MDPRQAEVEDAFALAYIDGDGAISLTELHKIASDLLHQSSISDEEVAKLVDVSLHAADKDGNGVLSFDEFVEAYNNLIDRLGAIAPAAPKLAEQTNALQSNLEHAATMAKPAEWTLREWVSTTEVDDAVARELQRYAGSDGPDALEFLQGLSGRESIAQHVRKDAQLVDAIIDALAAGVSRLKEYTTDSAAALQDKFLQEGAGLLSYGGLNKFFGGLEQLVGAPSPRVHEALVEEHTKRPDSLEEFTTSNYGITTTSKI